MPASRNVLIANTCSWDEEFDLQIGLDRRFDTNPNGNPGNAIHTYDSAGIVEPSDFDIDAFGAGTGQGQNLCLQSVSVPAGPSFLAAVHSALINRLPLSELQPSPFVFGAKLTAPGTACGGQLIYSLDANPLTLEVPASPPAVRPLVSTVCTAQSLRLNWSSILFAMRSMSKPRM